MKIKLKKSDTKKRKSQSHNASETRKSKSHNVSKTLNESETLEIGNHVRILNPRRGQGTEGFIVNINEKTDYVTVETTKGKVVRAQFNVVKIN